MCSVTCGNGTRYRQRRCNQEVPNAECKNTEYGDEHTEDCNDGTCPATFLSGDKHTEDCDDGACPATIPSGVISIVAVVVTVILIGIVGIVAFKFRHVIGGKLRGQRRIESPAPRVAISLRKMGVNERSSIIRHNSKPISLTTFRQLLRDRTIPEEDEYKSLGMADTRLNKLQKSKEAGLAANRNMDSPQNRLGAAQIKMD